MGKLWSEILAKTETSFESFPEICKSMELCTLCPWLFPNVIPRMIEPFELRSPKIFEREFLTRTASSTITLLLVLIKSKVSRTKTSLSIFAERIESCWVESSGRFGFFHVKICALVKINPLKNRKTAIKILLKSL